MIDKLAVAWVPKSAYDELKAALEQIAVDWQVVTGWMSVENTRKENPRHPIVVFDHLLREVLKRHSP